MILPTAIARGAEFERDKASMAKIIRTHRDHAAKSKLTRSIQLARFREVEEELRRRKTGRLPISVRELTASNQEERLRARWVRNKHEQRNRKPKPPKPLVGGIVVAIEHFEERYLLLENWLLRPEPRSRHLRGRIDDIMKSWLIMNDFQFAHRYRPSLAQFAQSFAGRFHVSITRSMAQRRIRLVETLHTPGGPWACVSL